MKFVVEVDLKNPKVATLQDVQEVTRALLRAVFENLPQNAPANEVFEMLLAGKGKMTFGEAAEPGTSDDDDVTQVRMVARAQLLAEPFDPRTAATEEERRNVRTRVHSDETTTIEA